MDRAALAARLGLLAALLVVALAALPYAVGDAVTVGAYYAPGVGGPPLASLFAIVAAIVLLAGIRGRTDPARAAGVAVALGGFVAFLALSWAASAEPALAGGITGFDAFRHHRWALALAGVGLLAAAAGYARAVL